MSGVKIGTCYVAEDEEAQKFDSTATLCTQRRDSEADLVAAHNLVGDLSAGSSTLDWLGSSGTRHTRKVVRPSYVPSLSFFIRRSCQTMTKMTARRHTVASLLLFGVVSFHTLFLHSVAAQEYPLYDTPKFDYATSHRTNVCSRSKLLLNDTITNVKDALRGLELSVILTDYRGTGDEALFSLDSDGKIPEADPGLFVVLLDELSQRAGFTWRNSFGMYKPLNSSTDGNQTWTDILVWATDTYDISVEYWSKLASRLNLGVSFPEGWYDSSIILVERVQRRSSSSQKSSFDLWSFLRPFDLYVWLLIAASVILTGLLYWFLEKINSEADARSLDTRPLSSIFLSAIVFTTHFEFRPNTSAAMLLSWSWTFWSLIVAAAYTANLAAFLSFAGQEQPHVFYASLDQVVRREVPICVNRYAAQDTYITEKYPSANLIRIDGQEELFTALREKRCDVVATQRFVFEQFSRRSVNSDCLLRTSGIAQSIVSGGFATAMDSGTYCSSLISHTINIHLIEMHADGFIENAWANFLKRTTDFQCQALAEAEKDDDLDDVDNQRLDVYDMGGIFCFHFILCAIAYLLAFIEHHKEKQLIAALKDSLHKHGTTADGDVEEDGQEDDAFFENEVDETVAQNRLREVELRQSSPPDMRVRQSMWNSGNRLVPESSKVGRKGERSNSVWNKNLRRRVPKTERRKKNMVNGTADVIETNGDTSLKPISED